MGSHHGHTLRLSPEVSCEELDTNMNVPRLFPGCEDRGTGDQHTPEVPSELGTESEHEKLLTTGPEAWRETLLGPKSTRVEL